MRHNAGLRLLTLLVALTAVVECEWCVAKFANAQAGERLLPPPVKREFRAAWVATVANIDWPSRRDLSSDQQQVELREIVAAAAAMNLNAIVFQVRPAADAVYASPLEPWSEFLTGQMGQAPEGGYDPLELLIELCHQRGIEVHAWLNPYRASHPSGSGEFSETHISRVHPELVLKYGEYLWLDPGLPQAEDHTIAVICDVVQRYDVDGIHFDDYFYPYPVSDEQRRELPFPDERSWQMARDRGVNLSREDWRRDNVNRMVKRVRAEIGRVKPHVRFGISPFGIWRPGYPEGIVGFDAYEKLYADARLWLQEGDVDYLSPQLYWSVDSQGQGYTKLLGWWHEQNRWQRHLWPGLYTSRLNPESATGWDADEILRQIAATRHQEGATGNIHFSFKALQRNWRDIARQLPYDEPALVPATPWLEIPVHDEPNATISVENGQLSVAMRLSPAVSAAPAPWLWVVQERYPDRWRTSVVPGWRSDYRLPRRDDGGVAILPDMVSVTAVNRA
ncbi:MAG: family 10 glycosylhydrolase, partial [Planctomycetales bacterium]|nr:family 10 glycosylhydrolase [Planctomycetales bacterium]